MKSALRVSLSAFLLIFSCALMPAGRLLAQQPTAQEIDQLTGPIALYPDAIVLHILTAAQSYDTLKLFAGWLEQNANLKGSELQDAAQKFGFADPLIALAPFPQVVQTMAQKPDWTKALGQAFAADGKAIFDSIQRLRGQAQALGNLKTTPQQVVIVTNTVVEKTVEERVVVVTNTIVQIQPANPQVIYVPTYPQTVYVQAAPPPSSASVAGAALVGFTVGVIVANNSYYHHYDNYYEHREDYYNERQDQARQNQDQRQTTAQGNQEQRQTTSQANQSQRQSTAQASQGQRQSASRSSGMSSGASYQSGSTTKAQSSRGSASMSSSRSSGGGGGRSSGGGGGRR